jgi:cytochrome c553
VKALVPVLLLLLGSTHGTAETTDSALIEAGRSKAAACMACHGVEGVSNNDLWPNLAGQRRLYLVKATKDYRDGHRQDVMMTPMAKPLSDQDIEEISAFYSSLSPR